MSRTYRHIVQGKINKFHREGRHLFRLDRAAYFLRRNSEQYKDDIVELSNNLPGNYTYDTWRYGRKSDWRLEGLQRKQKESKRLHDKEMNPYIYPIPYYDDACMYGWEHLLEDLIPEIDWDLDHRWGENAYDYPHKKRSIRDRGYYRLRGKPAQWEYKSRYYGNKPEHKNEFNIHSDGFPGECVHEWIYRDGWSNRTVKCKKCQTTRAKL